jgi:outer membrane protein OmpA-like peptidoglycan-associated protein
MLAKHQSRKSLAVSAIVSLALTGIFSFGAPALATTPTNPTIVFDGNGLATSVPATGTSTRTPTDSLTLTTDALNQVVTTSIAGYTFGGWSLTAGGPAVTAVTTATTSDTSRTLYAVWNTKVNYNSNGADSGSLAGSKTSDNYRYGQALPLPTAGTLVKSGFAFGGWLTSTSSTTRLTSYTAATTETGNRTLYAAWIKTVSFNPNGAATGTIPTALTYFAGGERLKLPTFSEMTLRRAGYEFLGWSTSPTGKVVSNPTSYVPIVSQRSLFAIWRIQSTKATSRVFFAPGKAVLRSGQKLILRDLADVLEGRNQIEVSLVARRYKSATSKLGKQRNTAVVRYLRSLGVEATFERTNVTGKGSSTVKKNNRVTLSADWLN